MDSSGRKFAGVSAPVPADPAAILAEADRIDALADRMSAEPGNYNSYSVVNDPALWKQVEDALGHTIWQRHGSTGDDHDQWADRMLSQMFDWGDAIHEMRAKANDLRGSVEPNRPYPWLSCGWCNRITGWVQSNRCDSCDEGITVRMNYLKLPSGGWIGGTNDINDVLHEGLKRHVFLRRLSRPECRHW